MWHCEFNSGATRAEQRSIDVRFDETYGPWFGHRVINEHEVLPPIISYYSSNTNQHHHILPPPPLPPPPYNVNPSYTQFPQHHVSRAQAIPEDYSSEPTNRPTDNTMTHHRFAFFDIIRRGGGYGLPLTSAMLLDDVAIFEEQHNADNLIHDLRRDVGFNTNSMSYEDFLNLAEQVGIVSTGLTKEDIICHLKTKRYNAFGATTSNLEQSPCTICQDEYEENDIVGSLECGHEYHRDCLTKWLQEKNVCPLCKSTALHVPHS